MYIPNPGIKNTILNSLILRYLNEINILLISRLFSTKLFPYAPNNMSEYSILSESQVQRQVTNCVSDMNQCIMLLTGAHLEYQEFFRGKLMFF